ncbi:MAG TPA: hypothetical protein VKM55_04980 [Candidatus Lokiarchaeia archaeon]|nr:hypothetical protein [Candidatus Lokiarchaeia archaeon]
MPITLTTTDIVFDLNLIVLVGFLFLGAFTMRSYRITRSRLVLFIGIAYFTIAISNLLILVVLPQYTVININPDYLEAIIESVQFLAAFFFFYGLKLIKPKKAGESTS